MQNIFLLYILHEEGKTNIKAKMLRDVGTAEPTTTSTRCREGRK